ncbi:MAG: hypothetical protein EOP84_09730 [Verrucomicrobiaceae bacterium]|nr:MAG: hypothetical protein EOP84_09730 [Verrucomicrobiaceae bacterium]
MPDHPCKLPGFTFREPDDGDDVKVLSVFILCDRTLSAYERAEVEQHFRAYFPSKSLQIIEWDLRMLVDPLDTEAASAQQCVDISGRDGFQFTAQ